MAGLVTTQELKLLREVLKDARTCERLTRWEKGFVTSLHNRTVQYDSDMLMSDPQWETFHEIESKVYQT